MGLLGNILGETNSENTLSQQEQLRFLSQSVLLEEAKNPEIIRLTMLLVSFGVLGLLIWATFAKVDEVAKTIGEIVPIGRVQEMQHFDGGIVAEILTHEGEIVNKDQILIKLDGAGTQEDLKRLRVEQVLLEMQSERLKAFINHLQPNFSKVPPEFSNKVREQMDVFRSMVQARDKELDVIKNQIAQKSDDLKILKEKANNLRQNLALAEDGFKMQEQLFKNGHISKIKFIEDQKNLNDIRSNLEESSHATEQAEKSLQEFQIRFESLEAQTTDQAYKQLDQVEGQISQNKETMMKLKNKSNRLELKSPVRGIVKSLAFNTIGGVIQPGQIIAVVVPIEEQLIAEVNISPKDVGHLEIGQPVNVKISSFDFSRYGGIEGKLTFVSATTFEDANKNRIYKGKISLSKNFIGENSTQNIIIPGMTVEADIITGRKTILDYLLKPIRYAVQGAFRER